MSSRSRFNRRSVFYNPEEDEGDDDDEPEEDEPEEEAEAGVEDEEADMQQQEVQDEGVRSFFPMAFGECPTKFTLPQFTWKEPLPRRRKRLYVHNMRSVLPMSERVR